MLLVDGSQKYETQTGASDEWTEPETSMYWIGALPAGTHTFVVQVRNLDAGRTITIGNTQGRVLITMEMPGLIEQ